MFYFQIKAKIIQMLTIYNKKNYLKKNIKQLSIRYAIKDKRFHIFFTYIFKATKQHRNKSNELHLCKIKIIKDKNHYLTMPICHNQSRV